MDKLGLVLRSVVFFLFPVPFLLGFAVSQDDWTAYIAYTAIAALVLAAAGAAWAALGRR